VGTGEDIDGGTATGKEAAASAEDCQGGQAREAVAGARVDGGGMTDTATAPSVLSPQPAKRRPGRPKGPNSRLSDDRVLRLEWTPTIKAFIRAVAKGLAPEVCVFGTRGDGKTMGAFGAMLAHAAEHQKAGYPLPTVWMGVADTFASHKIKTVPSLEDPMWKGCWRIHDSGHTAVAMVNGVEVVRLLLFGIEDQGAMDRVRMEVHGVWFEEPAPAAVLVQSSGVDLTAWSVALTSRRKGTQRLADGTTVPGSHCYPALITENYPDEDHWTWQRFLPQPGVSGTHPDDTARMWFRVPPGERASATQRAEWAHALKDRPDVLRRLLEGMPGTIQMGAQVAQGFREDLHVSKDRLQPMQGEPFVFGQDFGHTPATIIGQVWRGQCRVLAALPCEHGGIKQHLDNTVIPWLQTKAPWVLRGSKQYVRGCYDVAGETGEQTDIEVDPVGMLEKKLGGLWYPGPIEWESRKGCLLQGIHRHAAPGVLSLVIDPIDGLPLIRALSGRWYYPQDRLGKVSRDFPKKPNHPWEDLGDSFIYWLWALLSEAQPPGDVKVESDFVIGGGARVPAVLSSF
jgi:hypothetical protein